MARPAGSKNRTSFPNAPAAPAVTETRSTQAVVEKPAEIRRSYKEGSGQIEIPKSNSSAALFPESVPQEQIVQQIEQNVEPENVPRGTNEEQYQEPQQQPQQEQRSEEVKETEDQPISTPTDEVVYLEDILKKMNLDPSRVKTKTKVDGVETDVPIVDVKKSYQLDQHLTKRGQKIGEERRQLEALREELARTQQVPQETSTGDPQYDALRQELEQIKSILPAIQPVIYQNARQSLANELKGQGFPDFMDYVDKIDAHVGAEADEQKWRFYNTKEGAKQLYFQMKLEDQIKGTPKKAPEPVKSQPRPPIVKIDGGAQPSRPNVDDWNTKYNDLVIEWKKDPKRNKHLLPEILRMKGALTIE